VIAAFDKPVEKEKLLSLGVVKSAVFEKSGKLNQTESRIFGLKFSGLPWRTTLRCLLLFRNNKTWKAFFTS
jgi:hypothetical protein